jgi:hypothetical protein
MALRKQHPNTSPSDRRRERLRDVAASFRVDRYELGLDVSLNDRHATVDVVHKDGNVTAVVMVPDEWWVCEIVDGEITDRQRKVLTDKTSLPALRLPNWVRVVLDHVGVLS